MPGHAGDDQVKRPPSRVPVLKLGDLHVEAVLPGELGHPRVDLDPEHPTSGSLKWACGNTGADAHVKNVTAGTRGDDRLHQLLRVAGSGAVIALGVSPERFRDPTGVVRLG